MIKLASNISRLHNIAQTMGRGNSTRVNPLVPASVKTPSVNFNNTSNDPLHPSVSVNGKPPQSFATAAQADDVVNGPYRKARKSNQPFSDTLTPDEFAMLVNTLPVLGGNSKDIYQGAGVQARDAAVYGNQGTGFFSTIMPSPTPSRTTTNWNSPSPWNAYIGARINRTSLNDRYSKPQDTIDSNVEEYNIPLPNFSL